MVQYTFNQKLVLRPEGTILKEMQFYLRNKKSLRALGKQKSKAKKTLFQDIK